MRRLLLLISILFLILPSLVQAQKLTASASSSKVGLNSQFQVTYSLSGGTNQSFTRPSFNGFQIVGQTKSSGGGMTIIVNNKVVQGADAEEKWIFYLVPTATGKFTIEPAKAKVNGKIIESNSVSIEVVASAGQTNKQVQQNNNNVTKPANTKGQDVFVTASIDKTNPWVGEQVMVTYRIYTRVSVSEYVVNKVPAFTGFWAQEIRKENEKPLQYYEKINGQQYLVAEIRKTALFPQKSGTLTVDPLEVDCIIQQSNMNNYFDPFKDFFNDPFFKNPFQSFVQESKKKIKSNAITVKARELPENNKPETFTGNVGIFSFEAQLDKTRIKANEPGTLRITVSGKGNLSVLENPSVQFPSEFETYDPKAIDRITVNASGVSGSRTFEYLFIPRNEGNYKIPSIVFSYFDPVKSGYTTLNSPEFSIVVEKGSATNNGSSGKEDLKYIDSDIRYINDKDSSLYSTGRSFYGSWLFFILLLIPLISFIVFVILRRKHIALYNNQLLLRNRKATRMAHRRLKNAKRALAEKNSAKFHEEISKALWNFAADKLSIQTSDLNQENLILALNNKGVEEPLVNEYMQTITVCEYARFAPNASGSEMDSLYNKTVSLITSIDSKLKTK
ncbi:MAG: BatD family protein [Bacteroidota bacterium]